MTILFSGRFCRPHAGHFISLGRLGAKYDRVIVPLLDYPGQEFDVNYRFQMLLEMTMYLRGNFYVCTNCEHFAKITKKDIEMHGWEFDVYGSSNHACLINMASLGYRTVYVERAYDYSATDDRAIQKIKGVLNG